MGNLNLYPKWGYRENKMKDKLICIKSRVKEDTHQKLKTRAEQEERSMNYLINKALEQFLNQPTAIGISK